MCGVPFEGDGIFVSRYSREVIFFYCHSSNIFDSVCDDARFSVDNHFSVFDTRVEKRIVGIHSIVSRLSETESSSAHEYRFVTNKQLNE